MDVKFATARTVLCWFGWRAQRGRETRNEKNFSRVLDGATRMALMRALKWAPTWYVSADFPTFISYPDLIQRLAIKGFWDVSPDLSSGGSFQSSQWACSHGTLQNPWEVFSISTVSAALWYLLAHTPIILLQSDFNCSENLNTSSEPWRCQEFDSEVRLVPHGCPELHQDCRGFVSMFLPAVKSRVSRCGEFCSKLAILVPSRPAVFNSHCQILNF